MGRDNPHAGLPITDDDATIAAALEDVSIPTLMLSLVHMTGDASLIRGDLKPQGLFLNEVQGYMSEDDKAEVRRIALDAIRAYRDGGCRLPAPPDPDLIREMMSWLVCEPVPDEYVPMMLEEMELDGADARRVELGATPEARAAFPVVVIGCGQSGLLAGIRLRRGGHPVHDHREEPRCRWDVVRELVPRLSGRRRQPLLLLLVRAQRSVDGVLRPPARDPVVLLRRHAPPRHRRAHPVEHRGRRRALGRHHERLGGRDPIRRRHRGDVARPRTHLGRRPAQPPEPPRHRRDRDVRGRVVPLRALGSFRRLPGQAGRASWGPARAGSRSSPPSRPTSPRSRSSNAPRSGCSPTRTTTRRSGPACSGPCAICRSTVVGTASCCSGRAATVGSPPRASTPTGRRTTGARSAQPTTSPASSSPPGSPNRRETTRNCSRR